MGDIKSKPLLYLKGLLFAGLGIIAVTIILVEHFELRLAILLAVAIWSFCRAYYFAFYVIQHYVDPSYRFSGLWDFARYLWAHRRSQTLQN